MNTLARAADRADVTELPDAGALCLATLAQGSRSFDLAGRLLSLPIRKNAAVLYTFCRRADDAIDQAEPGEAEAALALLHERVSSVYRGEPQPDVAYRAFAELVRNVNLPRAYPEQLLAGFAMDVRGARYESLDDLLLYCHRVAGVVGLMMCHVLGLARDSALVQAAHLGLALQLTNICRDVAEDWQLGRLYLPAQLLTRFGATDLAAELGRPLPQSAQQPIARTVASLLDTADSLYRSADLGLAALPYRASLAIRTARLVYAEIGEEVRRRGCDPFGGRAVVSGSRKLGLLTRALWQSLGELPLRAARPARYQLPGSIAEYPRDILPVT